MALNASGHTVIIDIKVGRGTGQADQAIQKVSRSTKQAGTNAANTRQQFANLAGAFTGLMAAKWVKQGLGALMKPAIDYETAMVRIKTITNATDVDMVKFKKRIDEVAAVSPFAPVELAEAMVELNRVAGGTDEAMKALNTTTSLSMAGLGKLGLAQATTMVSQIIRSFGLRTDDAKDAVERLVAISQTGKVGLEEFQSVMGRLATAAAQGGQSFDEVVKAFTLIRRMGMQPTRIVRTLSTALGELAKGNARDVLEGQGFTIFDSVTKKMLPMSKIMLQLSKEWQRDSEHTRELINLAFGRTAGRTITNYMQQLTGAYKGLKGAAVFADMDDAVLRSGGILERFAQQWLGTTSAQLTLLGDKVQIVAREIGKRLIPHIIALAKGIGGLLKELTEWTKTPFGDFITTHFVKVAAATVVVWALRAAFAGFLGIIRVVTANMGGMFVARVVTASGAMTTLTWKARLAGIAMKGFWAAATFGLAYLPDIIAGLDNLFGAGSEGKKREASLKEIGMTGPEAAGKWLKENAKLGADFTDNWMNFRRAVAWGTEAGIPGFEGTFDFASTFVNTGKDFLTSMDRSAQFSDKWVDNARKMKDLAEVSTKIWGDGVHLAGRGIQQFLKAAKGESKYEPAEAKGKYFQSVRKRLKAAGGRVSGADAPMVGAALKAMAFAEPLIQKAASGIITPTEHKQLMQALLNVGVVGTDLSRMYGPQIMGRKLMKSFNEKFTGEIVKMGTPEAMAYQARLIQMRGFKSPTTGAQLPGTTPSAGYRGVGKDYPWHGKAYPGPAKPWEDQGSSDSGVVAGDVGPELPSIKVPQIDGVLNELIATGKTMRGILNALGGPLKIDLSGRDPLGGFGS